MSKFITKFETTAAYEAAQSGLALPNVSLTTDNAEVHYAPIIKVSGVSLNKSALNLNIGKSETLVATVLPTEASNKSVIWSSNNQSVATVSNNGVVTAVGNGNAIITVTTEDGGFTAQCSTTVVTTPKVDGHEYVQIGGLKWATMNVGATAETEGGLIFQWGDTQGYTAAQVGVNKQFCEEDCKYGPLNWDDEKNYGMTKYNNTDKKTVLDNSDDAVKAAWGGGWRMPTIAEYQALGNAVNTAWTTDYQSTGVAGLVCTAKSDGATLFFPEYLFGRCGNCYDGCQYWSSTRHGEEVDRGLCGDFRSFDSDWFAADDRYAGLAVRGVHA